MLDAHLEPFIINDWSFLLISCIGLNRSLHIWCESDDSWECEHYIVLWQQAIGILAFVGRQLPVSLT